MRTIIELMEASAEAFQPWSEWAAWRAYLKGMYGLPMTAEEAEIFRRHTDREPPTTASPELYAIVGRRGGKSAIGALIAVHHAADYDHTPHLRPGEIARSIVLSPTRDQSSTILHYAKGIIDLVPDLHRRVQAHDSGSILFSGSAAVNVYSQSFRNVRSRTACAIILDEFAFLRSDDLANPDTEVLRACRPMLLTLAKHGAVLWAGSSPYSKVGELWRAFRDSFGQDGRQLVWKARTVDMHPGVDRGLIEQAFNDDPEAASAEYDAEFRASISNPFDAALVESLARSEPLEIPPQDNIHYIAFCDPSGGAAGGDEMTVAIGHRDGKRLVVDLIDAVAGPFAPPTIVARFAETLKRYRVKQVHGDKYAAEWPVAAFSDVGIEYRPALLSKSEIYAEVLPLFSQGAIQLPPDRRMLVQFAQIERRASPSGDKFDHPTRGHDDRSNAIAGVLAMLDKSGRVPKTPTAPIMFGVGTGGITAPLLDRKPPAPERHDGWYRKP